MKTNKKFINLSIILFIFIFLFSTKNASAYYTNMEASVVIGRPDFTSTNSSGSGNATSTTLDQPQDLIVINGKLIVADQINHRVLIWNSVPTTNGVAADVVIGQPDFTSDTLNNGGVSSKALAHATGVASDGQRLIVSDRNNHRVLIWNEIPTTNFADADVVIGQINFASRAENQGGSPGANTINRPERVYFDGTRLFVADSGNNRVLIYNSLPTSNNASADVVLGQPDFASNTLNNGGISASTLGYPMGINSDGNHLLVGDQANNRVLAWTSIPSTNGQAADYVIGQPDFTSSSSNQGGTPGANTLSNGWNPLIDGDRVYIGDFGNNRVLLYNSFPSTNNISATVVLGQPDFNSNTPNYGGVSASSFDGPESMKVYDNKLYIPDSVNSRILIFENIISTPGIHIREFEGIDGKLRVHGSVHLGEPETYHLHDVRFSLNGGESKFVTHIEEGETYGEVNIYEWYHDFFPPENNQYTLKFTSSSQNADDSSLFYINPFNLNSINGNIVFSVPKDHVNNIKNEISHFEIYSRINNQSEWTKLGENISTDNIDEHGTISVNLFATGEVKAVAVTKGSNWRQDSNTLNSQNVGGYINPNNYFISNSWFPLQINTISGVTKNILSSFAPSGIDSIYRSGTKTPTFTGIAFNNSTVAMRVTDLTNSDEYREYFATSTDSNWSITPTLYSKSVINLSVYDNFGNYNQILPLTINLY